MNREEKIEKIRKGKFFSIGDIPVFLVAALLILLFTWLAFLQPKEKGSSFSVYYRGEKIYSASLQEDAEYVFYLEDGQGKVSVYQDKMELHDYNRLSVKDGRISVAQADCPDKTCELLGETDWGEILCLPHDLKIVVEGEGLETDL